MGSAVFSSIQAKPNSETLANRARPARMTALLPVESREMRKALLLYNPLSGRRRGRRLADVESAAVVLRAGGVHASASATRAAGDATEQVKLAIAEGCDTVFACGGDGTVHDVLQGLVGTDASLGIIPLGTANSLAHDLGFPTSPSGAARAALSARPRRTAVGLLQYRDFGGKPQARYFTVAVGIGVDAHLFYNLNPVAKRHLGMMAYYVKATRLWLTHRMENFEVEISDGTPRRVEVSQILAVRIQDFGGILRELAPGASLERDDLRLVLFHTRSRAAYLGYIIRGLLGKRWKVPGIELVHSGGANCRLATSACSVSRIFVEADGELLGTLPAEISVVPNALNLLVPLSQKAAT
jgi:YegS/Rv2252/BmrU family lipid kinase